MKLQETRGHHRLMLLFMALVFALALYPNQAHAQIIGNLEVNIPFQFHAGNVKLPPGKYQIHLLEGTDTGVMEIANVDGSTAALFEVQQAQANASPAKSELIFDKYGNHYFLTKLFDEGSRSGSQVLESQYEKRVAQGAAEGQEHVPAHHAGN
jgi:hypothetical protein